MFYNVKLTEEALEKIKQITGIKGGNLNFKTGVLRVISKDLIEEIAEKYGVDNVNHKPYSAKKAAAKSHEEVNFQNLSLEERRQIVGGVIQIGSIVRIRSDKECWHIVITAIEREWFEGTRIILNDYGYNAETEVLLVNGEDVIYKNSTYKKRVRVLKNVIGTLKYENILDRGSGKVVGKVVKEETLQRILDLVSKDNGPKTEQSPTTLQDTSNLPVTGSDEVPKNVGTSEIHEKAGKPGEPENVSKAKMHENAGEGDASEEADKDVNLESSNDEEADIEKEILFEEVIKDVTSCEELIAKLKLEDSILITAVKVCVSQRRFGMKMLLPTLQKEPNFKGLRQNVIKVMLNKVLAIWIEENNVSMEEETLSYFLKKIVKNSSI